MSLIFLRNWFANFFEKSNFPFSIWHSTHIAKLLPSSSTFETIAAIKMSSHPSAITYVIFNMIVFCKSL